MTQLMFRTGSPRRRWGWRLLGLLLILTVIGFYQVYKPLPAGLNLEAPARIATDVRFLADNTYLDADGERRKG